MSQKYVVYFCEHLRDGEESGAKIKSSLEEALHFINEGNWWPKDNISFKLFKLGDEIPLTKIIFKA